jgi:hypothetical protein
MVDMKVMVYSDFSKNENKWNLQALWGMEDFNFPSVGKVQKMGVLYTHSPKMPGASSNFFIIL